MMRPIGIALACVLGCDVRPATSDAVDACEGALEVPFVYGPQGTERPRELVHLVPMPPPPRTPAALTAEKPSESIGAQGLFDEASSGTTPPGDTLLLCRINVEDAHRFDDIVDVGKVLTLGIVPMRMRFDKAATFELTLGGAAPDGVGYDMVTRPHVMAKRTKLALHERVAWTVRWNDKNALGPLATTFEGSMPIVAKGHELGFECRGYDSDAQAGARARFETAADTALAKSDSDAPDLGALAKLQGELALLEGNEDTRVVRLGEKLARARNDLNERGPRLVAAMAREASARATWAPVDDAFEARAMGVVCYRGGYYVCNVELEVRARIDNASLCPGAASLGVLAFSERDDLGNEYPMNVAAVSTRGTFITRRESLRRIARGETYVVELGVAGIPYDAESNRPSRWSIPITVVASGDRRKAFRLY